MLIRVSKAMHEIIQDKMNADAKVKVITLETQDGTEQVTVADDMYLGHLLIALTEGYEVNLREEMPDVFAGSVAKDIVKKAAYCFPQEDILYLYVNGFTQSRKEWETSDYAHSYKYATQCAKRLQALPRDLFVAAIAELGH